MANNDSEYTDPIANDNSRTLTSYGQSMSGWYLTLFLGINATLAVLTVGAWITSTFAIDGILVDWAIAFSATLAAISAFRWRIYGGLDE